MYTISGSLCGLFNSSLSQGWVPNTWKGGNVVPVYKGKNDKECVNNYRPITLISNVSKLLERVVFRN